MWMSLDILIAVERSQVLEAVRSGEDIFTQLMVM
jgi:hypothetical protein